MRIYANLVEQVAEICRLAVNSTPIVKVSSIGGNQEITIATGTAGATTIFGGEVFTAAPK